MLLSYRGTPVTALVPLTIDRFIAIVFPLKHRVGYNRLYSYTAVVEAPGNYLIVYFLIV